jgi:hypothetical protein
MEPVIFEGRGSHQVSIKTKDTEAVVVDGKVVTKPIYRTESIVFKDIKKFRVEITDPELSKAMKEDPNRRFKIVTKDQLAKEKKERAEKREQSLPKGPIVDMLNRVLPEMVEEITKPLIERIEKLEKAKK